MGRSPGKLYILKEVFLDQLLDLPVLAGAGAGVGCWFLFGSLWLAIGVGVVVFGIAAVLCLGSIG